MHFLIDADLPRSVGDLIRSYGHNATDIRDIGMRRALDAAIAQHAQREGLCLLTDDFDFSDEGCLGDESVATGVPRTQRDSGAQLQAYGRPWRAQDQLWP